MGKEAQGAVVSGIVANAESYLKIGSVILGFFYVVGVLVSNIQLMGIGVSDFSILQIRNVMTGLLFLYYVVLLLVAVLPVSLLIFWSTRIFVSPAMSVTRKLIYVFGLLILFVVVLFSIVYMVGLLIGYVFPWGRSWETGFTEDSFSWAFLKKDFAVAYGQFAAAYFHKKIVVAAFALGIFLWFPISIAMKRLGFGLDENDDISPAVHVASMMFRGFFHSPAVGSFLVPAFFLVLFGFASESYPNMSYNLGGGQPVIGKLQLDAEFLKGPSALGLDAEFFSNNSFVIWHQSEKYLYASPLQDGGDSRMLAIDMGEVKAVEYLPIAIQLDAGGDVLAVYR